MPLALIRHELYLSWARHYGNGSRFYVADFRDTFFQRDPFAGLPPPAHPLELWLYAEHFPFKQFKRCPFNAGWVRNCWGKALFDGLKEQAALCSGSYLGTRAAVVHFETTLLTEVVSCVRDRAMARWWCGARGSSPLRTVRCVLTAARARAEVEDAVREDRRR